MAASVTAGLTQKNGTKQEFSFPAGTAEKPVDLRVLQESIKNLQKNTNEALTVLVNQEKASNNCSKNVEADDLDDEEEEDDEDEDENSSNQSKTNTNAKDFEPPLKKSKS